MSTDIDAFQLLLHGMRESFLDELGDRCDRIEHLILALERSPADREAFNGLYRDVHSLKGSGGTHGIGIITAVCHQLESFLTEAAGGGGFGDRFANGALAYLDLLRRIEAPARLDNPNYSAIEKELEALRRSALQSRKAGLIVDSSFMMVRIYEAALAALPVQLTIVNNDLEALECLARVPFDFVVVGGELQNLRGSGVIAAIQVSQGPNRDTPFMLVTSKRDGVPSWIRTRAVLARDQKLSENLAAAVKALV